MIGVLLICTGKYDQFVKPLLDSLDSNFLPGMSRTYYLFTDKDFVDDRVVHVKIARKGFPGDTLYRFHYFLSIEERLLKETTSLYYMDVDMLCVDTVGNEVLPSRSKKLVATAHPGFYFVDLGTPETNPISAAFIHSHEYRPCYWAGGFSGGETAAYLEMAKCIRNNVDADCSKNYVAIWHDESHLNRYLTSNLQHVKTLNPSYCYSKNHCINKLGVTPRLIALDKNHKEVRS